MEPVFHYVLPVLLLLFFFPRLRNKLGVKKILLLGLLSLTPDLDSLLFGQHRFLFHNIFFVFVIFLLFYFIFGRLIGFLSLYFVSSHLLFDLSKPGIALFYPFTSKLVYLDIIVSNAYKWFLHIDFGILGSGVVDPYYPCNFLFPFGALVLIFIFILIIIKGFINVRKSNSFWKVF